jgi:hypothetical protein
MAQPGQNAYIKLWRTILDPSKTGKGILASLEHKTAEPPRRFTPPVAGRGPALVVGGGILASALLAWSLYSGASPVMVQDAPPPGLAQAEQAAPAVPAPPPIAAGEAAAIVDEAPAPAPSPALAAVLAPTPIATVVMHRERLAARAHAKPKAKPVAARREQPRRPAPDTDVALLSALVAHANDSDVVEARGGDSTESLLQRCRRVGGEEGRLCGIRICATRAGDSACRAE